MPHQLRNAFILLVAVWAAPGIAVDIAINGEVTVVEKNEQRWWPSLNTERDYMLPPDLEVLPEADFAYAEGPSKPRYRIWVKPMLAERDYRENGWTLRNESGALLKNLKVVAFVKDDDQIVQPLLLGKREQLEPSVAWIGHLGLPDLGEIQVYWYAELNGQPTLGFVDNIEAANKSKAAKSPERISSSKAASAWSMVQLYEQANKPDLAREHARKFLEQYPETLEAELARELLGESVAESVDMATVVSEEQGLGSQVELSQELRARLHTLRVADLQYHNHPLNGSKELMYYDSRGYIHKGTTSFVGGFSYETPTPTQLRQSLGEAVRVAEVLRQYNDMLGRKSYELYLEDVRAEELASVNQQLESLAVLLRDLRGDENATSRRTEISKQRGDLLKERRWLERASFAEISAGIKGRQEAERQAIAAETQRRERQERLNSRMAQAIQLFNTDELRYCRCVQRHISVQTAGVQSGIRKLESDPALISPGAHCTWCRGTGFEPIWRNGQ